MKKLFWFGTLPALAACGGGSGSGGGDAERAAGEAVGLSIEHRREYCALDWLRIRQSVARSPSRRITRFRRRAQRASM